MKTVPSHGGHLDSDAKNLWNQKTAKTKTKTSHKNSSTSAPPPMKREHVMVEDILDEDDIMTSPLNPPNIDTTDQQESTSSTSHSATARHSNAKVHAPWYSTNNSLISRLWQRGPTNPIYLFYEEVSTNANGAGGNPGNKFYKCYHAQHKTLTITKAMCSNLNGESSHISVMQWDKLNIFQ